MGAERVADVVVVGYGAAGVCAALEARSRGADVVALDRANGGGAAALSGGIIYAGGRTWVRRQAGPKYSGEAMFSYLQVEICDMGKNTYRSLAAAATRNGARTHIHTPALSLSTDPHGGLVEVRASTLAGVPALSGAPTRGLLHSAV